VCVAFNEFPAFLPLRLSLFSSFSFLLLSSLLLSASLSLFLSLSLSLSLSLYFSDGQ